MGEVVIARFNGNRKQVVRYAIFQQVDGVSEFHDPAVFFWSIAGICFEFAFEMTLANADFIHQLQDRETPFRAINLLHGDRDLRINLIVVFQAVDKEPFDQANLLL